MTFVDPEVAKKMQQRNPTSYTDLASQGGSGPFNPGNTTPPYNPGNTSPSGTLIPGGPTSLTAVAAGGGSGPFNPTGPKSPNVQRGLVRSPQTTPMPPQPAPIDIASLLGNIQPGVGNMPMGSKPK
jgi:hypothetical protein